MTMQMIKQRVGGGETSSAAAAISKRDMTWTTHGTAEALIKTRLQQSLADIFDSFGLSVWFLL